MLRTITSSFFLFAAFLTASAQGNLPQLASCDASNTVILRHDGYTSCFSYDTNTPLWVAWELTPEKASAQTVSRTDEFLPDPLLSDRSPVTQDYTRSGYDRGHMAPAADFKWSWKAMEESFYLSNICPQDHVLNGDGPWLGLEKQCRAWGKHYEQMYIVAGPLFGSNPKTIGASRRIAVPDAFFKVVLKQFRGRWYAIGFIFPNESITGEGSFFSYATTVDEVEKRTGMDFFPFLADGIEAAVESSSDRSDWNYHLIPFKN